MKYIIKRIDQGGGYVAKYGCKCTYTLDIKKMRKFATIPEAESAYCKGNEIIVPIETVMD